MTEFDREVAERISSNGADDVLKEDARAHLLSSIRAKYSYNFAWLSRPIIQYPQDIVCIQELVWSIRPDLIIETGVAHGGSVSLSASMLALLDYCDAVEDGHSLDPRASKRKVIGIDIDIRRHNREAIESHPMAHLIELVEGSSVESGTVEQVWEIARNYSRVLICLDSNHTHEHVLAELEAYAPLTSMGSYCCVFDTLIEDLPDGLIQDRSWAPGNSPKTAVWEFIDRLDKETHVGADGNRLKLEIDHAIDNKLLVSAAPSGYLKRI